MKMKTSPLLRKTFWLLLTVFLVFAQLAYAAELTEEELQAMPTVSITYYIAEGGEAMVLDAIPTLNSLGKAYWAMLPSEAFSFPVTLNITASETAPYTFSPANGEALITDVTTADYEGTSTMITAYQNDVMVDTYQLYISTVEMPLIVEPTAEPTAEPTLEPTLEPTVEPTAEPTAEPTTEPTTEPTVDPTAEPTDTPVVTPTPTLGLPADISAMYPDYTVIDGSAVTNTTGVRFRSTPDSNSSTNIDFQVPQGTELWVHGSFTVGDREWAYIRYSNTDCFVWFSLITMDEPLITPTPTPTLTYTPTPSPSISPSESPTASPTTSPTVTIPAVNLYVGFAVTTTQVALRNDATFIDSAILKTLAADTLLYLNGQVDVSGTVWTGAQTYLGEAIIGLLPYSSVRTITPGEAQTYIDAYNAAHAPTPTPTPSPTPVPAQQSGYFLTMGDNVPLRNVPGSQSAISAWIAEDQVVYVNGQVYYEGFSWDVSNYNSLSGYIREDQLRPMTAQEISLYLSQTAPTSTPAQTAAPYDPYAVSSYGYVTSNAVNFRQTPGGTRIKTLNQYAFGLVLSSQYVDGSLWYNVNQSGTVGWVSGDFFKVLSLTELSSFLNSSEYLQGIMNSSSNTSTSSSSTGSATQGQVSAVEDWNVGMWQNPSGSLNASYEPFNPYATPTAPLTTASSSPEPTTTFEIGTMIPISYEEDTKETQSGNNWLGLVLGGIVLIGGAGGVYAYALTQNKKRKAAARSAAARQRSQQTASQNPSVRHAEAAPPMTAGQQKTQNPYAKPQQPAAPDTADVDRNGEQPPRTTGPRSSSHENHNDDNA